MDLRYTIDIDAPRARVWDVMLSHGTYEKWVAPFMEGSTFRGEFVTGGEVDFYAPGHGGTRVTLREVDAPALMDAVHVAVLNKDLEVDDDNDFAKNWNGSTEVYRLHEREGGTRLDVEITTHEAFRDMFEEAWPKALNVLKEIAEAG